ncbi:Uncharacterized protein DAT39_023400, partial [Clarias magur]
MNNNMYILSEHYTQVIIDLMEHISLGSEEGETCSDEATSGRRGIRMIGNIKEKSLSNTRSESDSLESYMALKPEWSSPDSSGGDIIDREQQNLNALNDYIDECGYPLLELNKLLFQVEKDGIHWTSVLYLLYFI